MRKKKSRELKTLNHHIEVPFRYFKSLGSFSTLFLSLIFTHTHSNAELSRDSKLLVEYNSIHFLKKEKSISTEFNGNINQNNDYSETRLFPKLSFSREKSKITQVKKYYEKIGSFLSYKSSRLESDHPDSINLLLQGLKLGFSYNNSFFKYSSHKENFFLGVSTTSDIYGQYQTKENYDTEFDPEIVSDNILDAFASNWIKEKSEKIYVNVKIDPKVGIGHINEKTTMLKALQVEKLLINREVIKFKLSDESLTSVANLISQYTDSKLRDIAGIEIFQNKLSTLISKDAASDREMMRYISPLDLKKILLVRHNYLKSGIKAEITSPINFTGIAENIDLKYPYDVFKRNNPYKDQTGSFKYRQDLMLKSKASKTLNKLLFLDFSASRILLSTDISPDFKKSNNTINWKNLLDIRWDLSTTFIPRYNLNIRAGINSLRTYLIVPNNVPYNTFLEFNFFIESYMKISAALNYNFDTSDDPYMYLYYSKDLLYEDYRKLAFKLLLCYNF